jgi:hypothetical protein
MGAISSEVAVVLPLLTVNAQRGLRSRLQSLGRNRSAAVLAYPVGALLTRPHRGFYLLGLAIQQLLRGLLQLALVREIGDIGRVLIDRTELAGDVALVAAQGGVVLDLPQRFEVLGAARQRILGLAVRLG